MRRLISVAATLVALALFTPGAVAQTGEAVAVDPALCTVEPRTAESLIPLLPTGTPVPRVPSSEAFVPPTGEPADAETVAAVTAFVHQVSACQQMGNMLALFALQTDDYTRGTFSRAAFTEEFVLALTVPTGAPEGVSSIVTINDVVILEDGRVGVSVVEELTTSGLVETFDMHYTLVEADGSYLLDEYTLISVT